MLKRLLKIIPASVAFLIMFVFLASCSSGSQANSGSPEVSPAFSFSPAIPAGKPAKAMQQVAIEVKVGSDSVTIPLYKVTQNWNTRFAVPVDGQNMTFMSYIWDGKLYVRADICPPCRSKSFTLLKGNLVCDSCGTVFNAVTGDGINGACVSYPKEAAPYELSGGFIKINKEDLAAAYKNTMIAN